VQEISPAGVLRNRLTGSIDWDGGSADLGQLATYGAMKLDAEVPASDVGVKLSYDSKAGENGELTFSFGKAGKSGAFYEDNQAAYKIVMVFAVDEIEVGGEFTGGQFYEINNTATLRYTDREGQPGTSDSTVSADWAAVSAGEIAYKQQRDPATGEYTSNPVTVVPGVTPGYEGVKPGDPLDLGYRISVLGIGAIGGNASEYVDVNKDGGALSGASKFYINDKEVAQGDWGFDLKKNSDTSFTITRTQAYGSQGKATTHRMDYTMRYNWKWGQVLTNSLAGDYDALVPLKVSLAKIDADTRQPLEGYRFDLFYVDSDDDPSNDKPVLGTDGQPIIFDAPDDTAYLALTSVDDGTVELKLVETSAPAGYAGNAGRTYPVTYVMKDGVASLSTDLELAVDAANGQQLTVGNTHDPKPGNPPEGPNTPPEGPDNPPQPPTPNPPVLPGEPSEPVEPITPKDPNSEVGAPSEKAKPETVTLPFTGANVMIPAALGLALLGAGIILRRK
jgi:hypothetical protein